MYRKITFEQYKKELVIFFKKINEKFVENKIFWWAHSGTLLGSVRNESFIEWDDDIDMAMTAKEFYSKIDLLESISNDLHFDIADKLDYNGLNSSRFISKEKVIVIFNEKEYLTSFFVDVMIAIPIKRESILRSWYWFVSNRYMILFSKFWRPLPKYRINKDSIVKNNWIIHSFIFIVRFLLLPLYLYKFVERKTVKIASRNDEFNKLELHYGWSHKRIYYNLDSMILKKIDDIDIWVTNDWDKELILRYGENYLIPPIECERLPKHFVLMPFDSDSLNPFPFIIM